MSVQHHIHSSWDFRLCPVSVMFALVKCSISSMFTFFILLESLWVCVVCVFLFVSRSVQCVSYRFRNGTISQHLNWRGWEEPTRNKSNESNINIGYTLFNRQSYKYCMRVWVSMWVLCFFHRCIFNALRAKSESMKPFIRCVCMLIACVCVCIRSHLPSFHPFPHSTTRF